MPPVLRLYEDVLSNDAAEVSLPALPRMIFVVHGSVTIADRTVARRRDLERRGRRCAQGRRRRRDALALGDWPRPMRRRCIGRPRRRLARKTHRPARHDCRKGPLLLRGDSVAFPPGGCAYLHRHQGPGIRCLLEGGIRIDTHGRSTSYGPGGAWYESGPDRCSRRRADRPTRFIRVMILPASPISAKARSSISTRRTRPSRSRSSTRFSPTCR